MRLDTYVRLLKKQKPVILSALEEYGIEVYTNGMSFRFKYNGLDIYFINHGNKLTGTMYRPPKTLEEKELLRKMMINQTTKFQKEFNYRSFVFSNSVIQAIHNIITLANTSIEDVIRLQDEDGVLRTDGIELEKKLDPSYKANKNYPRWISLIVEDYFR